MEIYTKIHKARLPRFIHTVLWGALALISLGCTTPDIKPVNIDELQASPLLAFIENGRTSREEMISRFGMPYSEYEQGLIVTYLFYEPFSGDFELWRSIDPYGFRRSPDKNSRICTLVNVYGQQNLLVEHALVCSRTFY
jgi:hypothetical protein